MKRTIRKAVFRSAVLLFLVGATAMLVAANAEAQVISYAAKFVCGPATADGDVVRGMYATAVNIHNPLLQTTVEFTKKAVVAYAERIQERGPISQRVKEFLRPDEAMYVDCRDIRLLFGTGVKLPGHIEGFVVIETLPLAESSDPLDVVAKYTARHRSGAAGTDPYSYDVESIDIEKISPKSVK